MRKLPVTFVHITVWLGGLWHVRKLPVISKGFSLAHLNQPEFGRRVSENKVVNSAFDECVCLTGLQIYMVYCIFFSSHSFADKK